MLTNKRENFLKSFLGFFDIEKIKFHEVKPEKISGLAIFNNEESQKFCWHISEENVPSDNLVELIEVIRSNSFHQLDKIVGKTEKIFEKTGWNDKDKFEKVFDELFTVEIKMVDDGEETDSFFIHD